MPPDTDHGTDAASDVGGSRDPRAMKTRQAVFDAVERLLREQGPALTLSTIITTAGISKSSFYAHFDGVDDVAAQLLRQTFSRIGGADTSAESQSLGRDAALRSYSHLLEHVSDFRDLYAQSALRDSLRNVFDRLIEAYALTLLDALTSPGETKPRAEQRFGSLYTAGGAITAIRAWLSGDLDITQEGLAALLVGMIPDWMFDEYDRSRKA